MNVVWMVSLVAHGQSPPPDSVSPGAGDALRSLLLDAGFEDIAGGATRPLTIAASTSPDGTNTPDGSDGSTAPMGSPPVGGTLGPPHVPGLPPAQMQPGGPGFLAQVRCGPCEPHGAPIITVGGVQYQLNDSGLDGDATADDGLWSAMIERYPAGHDLLVQVNEQQRARAPIVLTPTRSVPVMVLSLEDDQ